MNANKIPNSPPKTIKIFLKGPLTPRTSTVPPSTCASLKPRKTLKGALSQLIKRSSRTMVAFWGRENTLLIMSEYAAYHSTTNRHKRISLQMRYLGKRSKKLTIKWLPIPAQNQSPQPSVQNTHTATSRPQEPSLPSASKNGTNSATTRRPPTPPPPWSAAPPPASPRQPSSQCRAPPMAQPSI